MRVHRLQDGRGDLLANSAGQSLFHYDSAAPSNGVSGYAVGCIWMNYSGTAGTIFYVNQGTTTSATWINLV